MSVAEINKLVNGYQVPDEKFEQEIKELVKRAKETKTTQNFGGGELAIVLVTDLPLRTVLGCLSFFSSLLSRLRKSVIK
jgi:hypothetical protein